MTGLAIRRGRNLPDADGPDDNAAGGN
jgi:hypothetical protein